MLMLCCMRRVAMRVAHCKMSQLSVALVKVRARMILHTEEVNYSFRAHTCAKQQWF